MGIQIEKMGAASKKIIITCTYDRSFSKYYTNERISPNEEVTLNIVNLMGQAFNYFRTLYNILPKRVFIYRSGVSDEEKKQISEGARVRFNLLNFEEKDEKKVDVDVNYFLDISNIEKSKIAKQELEKFKNEINSSVGIYRLELNGKTYVGQSTDLRRRLTQHIESLIYGTHTNRELQNAWEIENLEIKFEILEYENLNQKGIQLQDWLASRERFHISHDRTLLKNINVLDGCFQDAK